MNGARWRELAPHLDRLLELDDTARARELARLRGDDAPLADELAAWLAEERLLRAQPFLEEPLGKTRLLSTLAGQSVGAYTLESPIGQGGMGTVWRAHRSDGRFEGLAAVKFLNLALVGQAGEERFRREGTILARLSHPHIASLVDAGVGPSGQPYLVLEYVEGEPIDSYCDARGLGVEDRLRLFLDVTEAVDHAHANLVVHRDLKPSNVLVSRDGRVKLLDFGIAKLLEEGAEIGMETGAGAGSPGALTREAGRVFTPAFAAPEQVTGGAVTTATDVHALGALLYLLLSGRHAAGDIASSAAELVKAIVDTDPPRLSLAVKDLRRSRHFRGDLDTIVGKALKKRPEERYASVHALADDLRRHLEHRPIAARPDSPAYRAAKFVRRHRLPVALAALTLVALVGGLAGTLLQARRAGRAAALAAAERDFALRELSRSEAINELNSFLLSDIAPGGQPFTVGALLEEAEAIVASPAVETDDNRAEILMTIGRQYHGQDQHARALRLLTEAYDLTRRSSDLAMRARAACALAGTLSEEDQAERAESLVREALAELPQAPLFVLHRIFCLLRGAEVARDAGDDDLSIARAESAERVRAESRQGSALLGLAVSMDLAESYRVAGRLRDASIAFEHAWKQLEALGRARTERAGTLLNNWGLTLRAMGQPLAAEVKLRRAIAIASAGQGAGGAESVSPMLLTNYARALNDLGRRSEAVTFADRALAAAHAAGNEQQVTFGLFLRNLIAVEAGDLALAARTLAELEPRVAKVAAGHQFHSGLAGQRALLAAARGETAAARADFDLAIELCNEGDLPIPLLRRSAFELAQRRPQAARTDAARALELSEKSAQPGTSSSRVGRAQLGLARALRAEGRSAEAREAFARALEHLEPALGSDHPETLEARRSAAELAATVAFSPP